jgi:hypothetical protein
MYSPMQGWLQDKRVPLQCWLIALLTYDFVREPELIPN